MKGTEVADFLRLNPYTSLAFQGVYPVDRLPPRVGYPCAIVINTDTVDGAGEHWTAVYIDSFEVGYHFDSLGLLPLHPFVIEFLNAHTVKWSQNSQPVQSVFSEKCGYFCLYFLYQKCRGVPLLTLLRPFSPYRLLHNDVWVTRWYNRHRPPLVQYGRVLSVRRQFVRSKCV